MSNFQIQMLKVILLQLLYVGCFGRAKRWFSGGYMWGDWGRRLMFHDVSGV
ncbi:hypothetical protein [Bartonella vinsonii]|uniref:hypothetical protein n=1 Tax=Bartonella vinsonii TaxID=33047 RepID=UPI0002EDDB42|nr:hypothetical protein [Bartonella vinsonii]